MSFREQKISKIIQCVWHLLIVIVIIDEKFLLLFFQWERTNKVDYINLRNNVFIDQLYSFFHQHYTPHMWHLSMHLCMYLIFKLEQRVPRSTYLHTSLSESPGANHLVVNGYKYFIYIIDTRFTENIRLPYCIPKYEHHCKFNNTWSKSAS
jgi:hypothetical protein